MPPAIIVSHVSGYVTSSRCVRRCLSEIETPIAKAWSNTEEALRREGIYPKTCHGWGRAVSLKFAV